MPTIEKRNFFSDTVAHPGGAVTLAALLRIGGWGLNAAGDAKSGDSFVGVHVRIVPASNAYIGADSDTDATNTLAAATLPFEISARAPGVVAADDIWIFSAAGQNMMILFQSV